MTGPSSLELSNVFILDNLGEEAFDNTGVAVVVDGLDDAFEFRKMSLFPCPLSDEEWQPTGPDAFTADAATAGPLAFGVFDVALGVHTGFIVTGKVEPFSDP